VLDTHAGSQADAALTDALSESPASALPEPPHPASMLPIRHSSKGCLIVVFKHLSSIYR